MRMSRKCIMGCSPGLPLHGFPRSETEPARRNAWLRALQVTAVWTPEFISACDMHFSEAQRSVKRLIKNAVPDINLPPPPLPMNSLSVSDRDIEAFSLVACKIYLEHSYADIFGENSTDSYSDEPSDAEPASYLEHSYADIFGENSTDCYSDEPSDSLDSE